jgi:phosphoribosylaminoimidazole-succinocarboxamide synthase
MSDAYIATVSERYIELYENITGETFVKADVSDIDTRIENNVSAYFNR